MKIPVAAALLLLAMPTCAQQPSQKTTSYTVAFSFSRRCLRDSCGDGAWGAAVNRNSQTAIDNSVNMCSSNTARQGSCGTGNGGRYFVGCLPGSQKWAALAIYDDQQETLADGEGIGYASRQTAEQAAVTNCGTQGCHAVWSQEVCPTGQVSGASCGNAPGVDSLDWANSMKTTSGQTITVQSTGSGILVHEYQSQDVTSKGNNDTTIPFSAIGQVGITEIQGMFLLGVYPKEGETFPEHQSEGYNNGDYQSHQWSTYFTSEAAAQEAQAFLKYHGCLGK